MGPHGSWYGKYFMLEKKETLSKVEMLINAYIVVKCVKCSNSTLRNDLLDRPFLLPNESKGLKIV